MIASRSASDSLSGTSSRRVARRLYRRRLVAALPHGGWEPLRSPHRHAPLRRHRRDRPEGAVPEQHRRGGALSPARKAGIAVRGVAGEGEPVRHGGATAESARARRPVERRPASTVEHHDTPAAHALGEVLVRGGDEDLLGLAANRAAPRRRRARRRLRTRPRPWARRRCRARGWPPPQAGTARGDPPVRRPRSCSRCRARCGTTARRDRSRSRGGWRLPPGREGGRCLASQRGCS